MFTRDFRKNILNIIHVNAKFSKVNEMDGSYFVKHACCRTNAPSKEILDERYHFTLSPLCDFNFALVG